VPAACGLGQRQDEVRGRRRRPQRRWALYAAWSENPGAAHVVAAVAGPAARCGRTCSITTVRSTRTEVAPRVNPQAVTVTPLRPPVGRHTRPGMGSDYAQVLRSARRRPR
jgi:hypothetical protein